MFNQQVLTVFPKWELLGSNTQLSYVTDIKFGSYSQYYFILNIILNQDNGIWKQKDINFIAGVLTSFSLLSNLKISNIKLLKLSISRCQTFYKNHFNFSADKYEISLINPTNNDTGNSSVLLYIETLNEERYQTNLFQLAVVKNNPPSSVYQIPDKIFYKGNLINTIFIDEDLFINDDILIQYFYFISYIK